MRICFLALRMRGVRFALPLFSVFLLLGACSTLIPRLAVPETLVAKAHISNLNDVRFFIDAPALSSDEFKKFALTVRQRLITHPRRDKTFNVLALSGGGANGAFGAGLLNGWSKSGQRPDFEVVTGVSTGALIAPFAFLGPAYDHKLKEIYTHLSEVNVAQLDILGGLLGGTAITNNSGMEALIAKYATKDLLDKIGQRYLTGRFLLIGTTDLDSQRGVIWDIGMLAASAHPRRLELFRKIILASASVPGIFPPVEFDVEVNGKNYRELHVDGGLTTQVFLYPESFSARKFDQLLGVKRRRRVFIIRNNSVTPEYNVTSAKLLAISARSIDTLIKNQGIGDLYRIFALAKRDGFEYNLAFIPPDFKSQRDEYFDEVYIGALYKLGETMGRRGGEWHKSPFLID